MKICFGMMLKRHLAMRDRSDAFGGERACFRRAARTLTKLYEVAYIVQPACQAHGGLREQRKRRCHPAWPSTHGKASRGSGFRYSAPRRPCPGVGTYAVERIRIMAKLTSF